MARPATPARATKALVAELHAQGVDCSSRRLEDWRRVGLIPRGHRRSLGRGRGSEVVYPDDMAERCRRVAERMRRGQPWQVVALSLFAGGADLPEETIRDGFRWALSTEVPSDHELDAAEHRVDELLSTAAGRRLQALVAAHVKRSRVTPDESPTSVARGVLTNLFLLSLGGEVANDEAMIELLAGIGLPITELPTDEAIQAARFVDSVLGNFSVQELADVAASAPIEELRGSVPVVAQLLFENVPEDVRNLVPPPVADLLPALLSPFVVQLRRLVASQRADIHAPDQPPAGSLSQRPATMGPMHLTRPSGPAESEAKSA